jgi:hypothetical protein
MPENQETKLVNLFKLEVRVKKLQRMIDEARESKDDPGPLDFSEVRRIAQELHELVK